MERGPRAYWFLSNLVTVHVSGDETGGSFCLVEFLTPPGDMTPLHVHSRANQTIYVLEGELTIHTPGSSRVLGPGECLVHPAGVPKSELVSSAVPARVLDVNSPAGFDAFLAAAGRPAESLVLPPDDPTPDLEQLAALAASHGLQVLGPPGDLP